MQTFQFLYAVKIHRDTRIYAQFSKKREDYQAVAKRQDVPVMFLMLTPVSQCWSQITSQQRCKATDTEEHSCPYVKPSQLVTYERYLCTINNNTDVDNSTLCFDIQTRQEFIGSDFCIYHIVQCSPYTSAFYQILGFCESTDTLDSIFNQYLDTEQKVCHRICF